MSKIRAMNNEGLFTEQHLQGRLVLPLINETQV